MVDSLAVSGDTAEAMRKNIDRVRADVERILEGRQRRREVLPNGVTHKGIKRFVAEMPEGMLRDWHSVIKKVPDAKNHEL